MTHLIVGEHDTPKYRHVAKDRPDIRPMAAGWVDAVLKLWVQDTEMDFPALEQQWQLRVLETSGGDPHAEPPQRVPLVCSVSGFEDAEERQRIIDQIEENGGVYTGDLTRKATHLIVSRPEGRKYAAAKKWDIHTVSPRWLDDSIERGMILDEKCYDPCLPADDLGKGAWTRKEVRRVSLGKRSREGTAVPQDEGGRRKLRKTASMKLSSQRDNLWGDILGNQQPVKEAPAEASPFDDAPTQPATGTSLHQRQSAQGSTASTGSLGAMQEIGVFDSCCFYVDGFSERRCEILVSTISSLGGIVCQSVDEVVSASGAQMSHRFLIVPQESKPDSHPKVPETVHVATEFYIEKCLHRMHFLSPTDHVIGRPFSVFPIDNFDSLIVCTAGFTGVDLNQVDKAIRQLGARYEERFTPQVSVLVCASLDVVRKQKLDLALAWKIPVVSADWLWECISTGTKALLKPYLFKALRQRLTPEQLGLHASRSSKSTDSADSVSQPRADFQPRPPAKATASKPAIREIDTSAFAPDNEPENPPKATRSHVSKQESTITNFETAPTHISRNPTPSTDSGPLSEVSSNVLNMSPNPQKDDKPEPTSRKPMSRVTSEIADSEATDGDVGDSTLMLALGESLELQQRDQQQQDPEPEAPLAEPEEQERRSKQARAAKDKAAQQAAERLAMSTKFTSLFDAAAGGATPATARRNSSVTAASAPAAASASRPLRRKREILGRATSNVSAGSGGGSVEPEARRGGGGVESGAASAAGSFTAGLAAGGESFEPESWVSDPVAQVPTSTQIGYEDEETMRAKERLMSKMLGTTADPVAKTRQQKKSALTIGDIAGMNQEAASAATGGVARRSGRRRG